MTYEGPERRAVITFTREDSDRLVRLEQQMLAMHATIESLLADQLADSNKKLAAQNARLSKIENLLNWIMGVGAAVIFGLSLFFGIHIRH